MTFFQSIVLRKWPGVLGCLLAAAVAASAVGQREAVLRTLNRDDTVEGTEQSKSYRLLFDAFLELSSPPEEISARFNQTTIHPGMSGWAAVSDWAESNPHMAEAILQCKNRNIIGLPYGTDGLDEAYQDADLIAGVAESFHRIEFPYLNAMDVIAAYATAEIYRLMEAGDAQGALNLAGAHSWVLRQLCDRQFLAEKLQGIQMLIDALANLRTVFYGYQDAISVEQYRELSWYDIPELRPDRNRLHIPEGDRVVSEALLDTVFDESSRADPEKFANAFASIQAEDAPLTRFGAARRWRMIAAVHDSLEASQERLKLIYDDWWRRWRVQEYDVILDIDTQFDRTNPVRYAAVIYSMQDIEEAFSVRNQLIAAVNGTAISAGLCAYKQIYGVYPGDKEKLYGQAVRKIISDIDPYDQNFGPLRYRLLSRPESIDTAAGRLRLEDGACILYSLGQDHSDDRASRHSDDGADGELVLWPPIRAVSREQGLLP
jgi:hypothetical protein